MTELNAIRSLAESFLGPDIAIERLAGGASSRVYYRLRGLSGDSLIAMWCPDARDEEASRKIDCADQRWPFIITTEYLSEKGVLVPKIKLDASEQGILLLEDAGDDTLADRLAKQEADAASLVEASIDSLATAHESLHNPPADHLIALRHFEASLLSWEMDHFWEWAVEAQGIAHQISDKEKFTRCRDEIIARIDAMPKGFVHRDYQSRNIMIQGTKDTLRLLWIDHQDAMQGPRIYDLVAFLGDSYQNYPRKQQLSLIAQYAKKRGLDQAQLLSEFDEVTVQRKLKDAGRFIFIDRVKRNPHFLPYYQPSLLRVQTALESLRDIPVYRDLADLLRSIKVL